MDGAGNPTAMQGKIAILPNGPLMVTGKDATRAGPVEAGDALTRSLGAPSPTSVSAVTQNS